MIMRRRQAATGAAAIFAVLAALALGWFSYWTFYNPHVDVPAPVVANFGGSGSGQGASALFLGDFAPTDRALPLIEKHGWGYQFEKVRDMLGAHDAVVANLEAPVTEHDKHKVEKSYIYKVHPDAVREIRRAGVDAVVLANNHIMDFGAKGLADTLAHLDSGGIYRVGADMSEAGARRGLLVETAGAKLGVLAYMQNRFHWRMRYMAFALDAPFRKWPGAARLNYEDLAEDIARMKKVSDQVAVVVHWGENYEPVDRWQKTLGHAIIDFGADIVIGHHPHWAQPVELYRGKPIVYSLGNFAFGTIGRNSMLFGMGAALHLEKSKIKAVELIPLLTQNRIVKYQPRIPTGNRLDRFFKELTEGSEPLGARIVRRGDRGWLELGSSRENSPLPFIVPK